MNDLAYLLPPSLAFLVAAGSPGPATLAVAGTAMAQGRRSALILGLGLALGLAVWGVVAAAGFGAAMLRYQPAMTALRIAGGLFLLYLAWGSARIALGGGGEATIRTAPSGGRLFWRGLALNLMNPKAVLAWTAVLALGLPAGAGAPEIWLIVSVCGGLGVAVYGIYAVGFSASAIMLGYRRFRRSIEAVLAVLFGLAAAKLIAGRSETP